MKQHLTAILALLLGVLLGFALRDRILIGANSNESVKQNNGSLDEGSKTLASILSNQGFTKEADALHADGNAQTNAETTFTERIALAISHPSQRQKLYELERVFASMSAAEAPIIFAEVLAVENPLERKRIMGVFFEQWGELDGQAAFDMAAELKGIEGNAARESALTGWARSDVYAAWDVAISIAEDSSYGMYSRFYTQGPFTEMAKQDPDKFLSYLSSAKTNRHQLANLSRYYVEAAFESGKPQQYWASIKEIGDLDNRNEVMENFFERWGTSGSEQPLEAIAAIDNDEDAQKALKGFLNGWATADPDGAIDYAFQNLDNPNVKKSIKGILDRAFYQGNAEQNRTLIDRMQSTDLDDDTLKDALGALSRTNPELAMEMIPSTADPKDREELELRAIRTLAHSNFDAATSHFKQVSSPEQKVRLFQSLNWHLMERNDGGERLTNLLRAVPEGEQRLQAIEEALLRASYRKNQLSHSYKDSLLRIVDSLDNLSGEAINVRNQLRDNP